MSNYSHNNANVRIVQMIQQLQQWNKKPSLNNIMSDFLDVFHESINKGQINFAEAGLFLQESSIFNGKHIDLLYKGFLECHKNLSDVYNEKPQEEETKNNDIVKVDDPVIEKPKKERKKCEIKKTDELKDNSVVEKNTDDLIFDLTNEPPSEKFSIPGIPDEILERLKLSDCLPGGPIDEFIDKLDKNHPLYSIISKLGKEISQNKDIFTYSNLSLSGMSWNALFKIEEVLSRITKKDDELDQNENQVRDECQQTQIDDDSGINTEHFTSGLTTGTSELLDVDGTAPVSDENLTLGGNAESTTGSEASPENPGASTESTTSSSLVKKDLSSSDLTENLGASLENPGALTESTSSSLVKNDESSSGSTENSEASPENPGASTESTTSSSLEKNDISSSGLAESSGASPENPEAPVKESSSQLDVTKIELTEELKKHITKECVEKMVKINLLKLDFKLLTKRFHFRLPSEYFAERKSERVRKRKAEAEEDNPTKRKKIENNRTPHSHTPKFFDLELFENFCYNYYESQGIILTRPQSIETNRKSIDNRSEVSYGNPLTPAESGRFSLSFMTDSECDHCDADDNCRDSTIPFSRADSGIEVMGPYSPESDHQDDLPECEVADEQNDTLKTLKTLFPVTFSDPERAAALKALYKQPEDDINYVQWKKFIDEKTANESEFNIHEYGTDILKSFSSHSTDTLNFETIVQDKSVGDISRYFVSALQLANTYNVEIIDKHPGEIRPDNMQLKFVTSRRAHEEIDSHLNDISEDHFMDSLVSNKKRFHSTPKCPNTLAAPSVHKSTKRKRLEYCY